MKKRWTLIAAAIAMAMSASGTADSLTAHPKTDVYDGWRMGTQAWTFRLFTFYEAIDKTRQLGLGWIEAYPGQDLSPEHKDLKMDPSLPVTIRKQVRETLAKAGITLVNYGVVSDLGRTEQDIRKVFDFARDMGIETIVAEPELSQMEILDKLCAEYKIGISIHNHPKPSKYWAPENVMKACEGRSEMIGACVDVGHWVRSGLDPIVCLKQLEGRIKSVHIKEIDNDQDVIWGTGQARMKSILEELNRQGYKGTFSIEYEAEWENNIPFIYKSLLYFNQAVGQLKPGGWKPLFLEDLSNADFTPGAWACQQGVVETKGGGKDLWTRDKYGDYILDMEYKLDSKSNSGIFLRAQDHNWLPWVEVQVADSFGEPVSRQVCGAIYDILAPKKNNVLPAGQWNRLTIKAQGAMIEEVLNWEPIISLNLDQWTEARKNPDGTENKFDVAYKDLPRSGFIGLQDHGFKITYRNIKIKQL